MPNAVQVPNAASSVDAVKQGRLRSRRRAGTAAAPAATSATSAPSSLGQESGAW